MLATLNLLLLKMLSVTIKVKIIIRRRYGTRADVVTHRPTPGWPLT